jgi:hypothetical protein
MLLKRWALKPSLSSLFSSSFSKFYFVLTLQATVLPFA